MVSHIQGRSFSFGKPSQTHPGVPHGSGGGGDSKSCHVDNED